MLNKAYSKEVDDLVDRYCNENGLNSALTKQKLDEKYPNKWKDVYETVNYAELINILGLGKYSGKYTDYESMKSFLLKKITGPIFIISKQKPKRVRLKKQRQKTQMTVQICKNPSQNTQ